MFFIWKLFKFVFKSIILLLVVSALVVVWYKNKPSTNIKSVSNTEEKSVPAKLSLVPGVKVLVSPSPESSNSVFWNPDKENSTTLRLGFGKTLHTWDPLLGGVIWIQSKKTARAQASALSSYPDNLLINIKADSNGFGYRFDTNTFDPSTKEYGYFSFSGPTEDQPSNLDDIFQIYGASKNVKFILHVPVPNKSLILGDERFSWQTPQFYSAELQYLFGTADSEEVYKKLPLSLDFSKQPVDFNWANLRARRGHVSPYKVEAVMFGEEPYHIEGWDSADGVGYGEMVESYRTEMRKRSVDVPYGVHVSQLNATDREWFNPMLDAISKIDPPTYFDLYHYYTFAGTEDWERSYPISIRPEGFSNWWIQKTEWQANYTRFLWLIEDTKIALQKRGIDLDKVKIGFSEHGITISSPFKYNDMMGAIHFGTWLSEIMRYNTDWDSMWVLAAEGFSTAQIQTYKSITKTPAYFTYQMAMKLRGMKYVELTAKDVPLGKTTNPAGQEVVFPWIVVRAFEDTKTGNRELFAINQHPKNSITLTGFDGWKILKWEELRGNKYSSGNSLDSNLTPVSTKIIAKKAEDPLTLPPISIVRITLTR